MSTVGMRSLLGGHGFGGVACSPFRGVVVVCGQWLASCFALVLCRSQVPPSCTKVSLNPKKLCYKDGKDVLRSQLQFGVPELCRASVLVESSIE